MEGWELTTTRTKQAAPQRKRVAWGVRIADLRHDANGSYSIGTLFVLAIFLLMVHMIVNIAQTAFTKLELQNAADAISHAASTELARGMNSVTAVNHLTGEAQAIVVLHHALGGYELEGRDDPHDPQASRQRASRQRTAIRSLRSSWVEVLRSRPSPPPFMGSRLANLGLDNSRIGATIYDTRMQLRNQLEAAYWLHALGGWLQKSPVPWVRAVGYIIAGVAYVQEMILFPQLVYLEYVEQVARVSSPFKRFTESETIPALQMYAREAKWGAANSASRLAGVIADEMDCEAELYPPTAISVFHRSLTLPVVAESTSVPIKHSQVVRASFPWITLWKDAIKDSLQDKLPSTSAGDFYRNHSLEFTLKKGTDTRDKLGTLLGMYVLEDLKPDGVEKGDEPWNAAAGRARADELFSVLGFARRPAVIYSAKYFQSPHADGQVAMAQCLLYNANPQLGRTSTTHQPLVGFDTLNWVGKVPEFPTESSQIPQIKLNWQAKLVPVTRSRESALRNRSDWTGRVTRRLPVYSSLTNTH